MKNIAFRSKFYLSRVYNFHKNTVKFYNMNKYLTSEAVRILYINNNKN